LNIEEHIIEHLKAGNAVSTAELLRLLKRQGLALGIYELYKALIKLESRHIIRRLHDETFDPLRPAETIRWLLIKEERPPQYKKEEGEPTQIKVVITAPPSKPGLSSMLNKYNIRALAEVVEELVLSAERELRIICPFIDSFLATLLIKSGNIIEGKVRVRIISEQRDSTTFRTLSYLSRTLSSVEVVFADEYKHLSQGPRKVFGVHAKAVSADDEKLLVGSFNLNLPHLMVNFDVGLLVAGPIVQLFNKMFDELWLLLGGKTCK